MTNPLWLRPTRVAVLLLALLPAGCSDDSPGPLGPGPQDPMTDGMVRIPSGAFEMGLPDSLADSSLNADLDRTPAHLVKLSAFWLDTFEVTSTEYQACVATGDCTPAGSVSGCNGDRSGFGSHPINCVTWEQAASYCAAQGKRLPSEAEWELAARGVEGRTYPWGETTPSSSLVNFADSGLEGTEAVGLRFGRTPQGVENLGGNVSEWTADWYDASYYRASPTINPPGPATGTGRVARGGAFDQPSTTLAASVRRNFNPLNPDPSVGFRCAWPLESESPFADPVVDHAVSATGTTPAQILSLDLSGQDVERLQGIEALTSLQSLSLADNEVADLTPLRTLTSLRDLDLSRNRVSQLTDLQGLNGLNRLLINGRTNTSSRIDDLSPLANLTQLSVLALANQAITDLRPLARMQGLTALVLNGNQVSELAPLAAMTSLTVLSLNDNRITDLEPLLELNNLGVLHLSGNPLGDRALETQIDRLEAKGVQVDFTGVVFIDPHLAAAVREQLGKLDATTPILPSELMQITVLDASGREARGEIAERRIARLDGIEALTQLEVLRLSNNTIQDLTPLSGLTRLTALRLSGNRVQKLDALSGLTNLTVLEIADNDVRTLGALFGLPNLTTLDVTGNPLTSADEVERLRERGGAPARAWRRAGPCRV